MEREHQYILNVSRALKIQSGLSTSFWTYFIGHAVHLINRTPTPLLDDISPYEKLYGKPVDYSSLKLFGCLVYISTLTRDTQKFDNRAKVGIFIGHESGMKGCRV